jgi:phenylacetic acid degradation operon negative regulatory protein
MPSETFAGSIAALRALGGQRVWSLMISLFGDLAQGKGDVIDGPVLSRIMTALHVKPEATRVALHRLRNDGWIASEKSGRISQHSLTALGRAESAAASPRIYAPPPDLTEGWQLVLTPDSEPDVALTDFTPLLPRVCVGPLTAKPPLGSVALTGPTPPAWLTAEAAPQAQREEYAALAATLAELKHALPDPAQLSATDVAVLRCLIVHNWRRLVLKHSRVPGALVPQDWPGYHAHLLVAELLSRFARPDLADIRRRRTGA